MNSANSFHLKRGAIHELAYWERPCIKLMKCEAGLIYRLLHVHLKWKINPNKTLTQRKNENKWRCILKAGSTSETWDLRHVRVCLCACINAPKVIQCSSYDSGLSVHPFLYTCRSCGCYEAIFFSFGFFKQNRNFYPPPLSTQCKNPLFGPSTTVQPISLFICLNFFSRVIGNKTFFPRRIGIG